MSEAPSPEPPRSGLLAGIAGPQDFIGGIALMAIAAFAYWASSDLGGMRGFSFGPGTAPRLFSGLLFALGLGVTISGFLTKGAPLQRFAIRGPVFVTAAIFFFAFAIRPLGLVISAFVTFMIAAMGSDETKWKEAIVVGVALTIFCSFLFTYGLGLPFQLRPRFL